MSQIPLTTNNLPEELAEQDYWLAANYNETYGFLMPVDPERTYVHWEISPSAQRMFTEKYGEQSWENSRLTLRLSWPGHQKIVSLSDSASNWYVHLGSNSMPDKGEIGRLLPDNTFVPLLVVTMFWKMKGYSVWREANKRLVNRQLLTQSLSSWKSGISS